MNELERLRAIIANDSLAISFQSMGQYRTMLLKAIDNQLAEVNKLAVAGVSGSTGWETTDFMYGIKVLLSEKPKDKSLLKAIEELGELSVKLLQYINKPESISEGDIEEEIADCEMHFHILKSYFPVSQNIRERKIDKFLQSKDYKQYKAKYEGK